MDWCAQTFRKLTRSGPRRQACSDIGVTPSIAAARIWDQRVIRKVGFRKRKPRHDRVSQRSG
jgi:hypothetical protein